MLRGTIKRACKNTLELWTTEKKEDLFTNSGLKDDLTDCCALAVIIWLHCFSIVGLVTTRNECNGFCLIGDSISVQAECESLEWKIPTVLKVNVLIGTSV